MKEKIWRNRKKIMVVMFVLCAIAEVGYVGHFIKNGSLPIAYLLAMIFMPLWCFFHWEQFWN
jgi:hypothetical protein